MVNVRVVNLTKRFGNVVAVDRVTFEVKDKEFVVLLGPSGSGKTTTLRIIAGLETPDEGEIYIGGQLVNDLPPKDRDVAMVFQSYALYPHMTVYENLAFPLKIRKFPKAEIDKKVKEVAELLRISHLLNRKPKQLSGGEQQRVALGRALVREPKVFLMDEPLSNLDAKLRVYMRAELKKMQKELGITTIYVTHDQAEAMTMADRIAVYNQGRIQQMATPGELYHKPANLFVAGFIGSPGMNFFDATLEKKNDKMILDAGEFGLTLPSTITEHLKELVLPMDVVLGIRPEHINVYREEVPNSIETEVYVIEPLGSEIIIDFKMGDSIYKIKYPGEIELNTGDKIYILFDISKVHIFDKKTGKAII
ncbi:MAG: sugar ABC transporter ATP-binding protein [Thermoprotei archaeon]|nr:MAG: sugar ABC transporter ATP-binding protein [Thermoprotei archaeon]